MYRHTPRVQVRRPGTLRATYVTFCLILLAAAAAMSWHRPASGQGAEEDKLKTISDMIVVKRAGGDVIYAADGDTGAIFFLEAGGAQGARPYGDFKRLKLTSFNFKKPTGLAYRQGKLVGCDPLANACFEIDLDAEGQPTLRTIVARGLVRGPKHVAMSEAGVLAVASDEQVQFFTPGVDEPRTVVSGVRDIDRIGFDGQTLVLLDEAGAGDLYGFGPDAGPEPLNVSTKGYPKFLPAGVRGGLPDLKDFTLFRGVYYLAGKKELFAVTRPQPVAVTDPEVMPLGLPPDAERDFNRLAVSEETVYISDEGRRLLLSAPRPVPVVVEFPYASHIVAEQQAAIIEQLGKRGELARRTIISRAVYNSITDFVRAEMLSKPQPAVTQPTVTQPAGTPSTVPLPANSASVERLADLVCKFNGWECVTTPAVQRGGAGVVFRRNEIKIGRGHEVIVPSASAKGYVVEKVRREQGPHVGLENLLSERGIVALTTQPQALAPGDIVRIDADQQAAPTAEAKCDAPPDAVESSSTVFPMEVRLEPEAFAAQLGAGVAARDWRQLRITDVAARYTNIAFDRLNLSAADKKTSCARAAADPGAYVIDRVLVAASANYTFLDGNGKPFAPNSNEFAKLGLPGTPDPNNKGGWVMPTRLVLGYRAFGLTPDAAHGGVEIAYLEPTPVTTKVYVQELTLLLDSAKVADLLRELNSPAARSRVRFYAFSAQDAELPQGGQKTLGTRAGVPAAPQSQAALDSRVTLRRLINFPEELSKKIDLEGIKVGVVEDPETIDYHHQSFFGEKGEWSWGDDPPAARSDLSARQNFHGTQVASIIGAKKGLLGLAPTARLVRINFKRLWPEMKESVKDNVYIYNISMYLPKEEDFTALIETLGGGELGSPDILLVVAAGDEDVDYSLGVAGDNRKFPPVTWLTRLTENVVVVGNSTSTAVPRLNDRANHSKKYVHLLAPGDTIYTASGNDGYEAASGSSLATPQVTAVAAMLRGGRVSTSWIKAVLIYTADWYASLSDKAWGGVLNAQRAYDTIGNNYPNNIYYPGETAPRFARLLNKGADKITIRSGACVNDPNKKNSFCNEISNDKTLAFRDVLRMQRLGDGSFHVVYLEEGTTMRMLYNAKIDGVIKCEVEVKTNAAGQSVTDERDACAGVAGGGKVGQITFNSIQDYVAKPRHGRVKFPGVSDAQ
jgi:hypothetical protein